MTSANSQKLAKLQQAWQEMLDEVLKRGFFGAVVIKMNVQDGTIQDIRRKVERIDK